MNLKAWCLTGISVVFMVMLLGSSYKQSIERQTWLLRQAELIEMLQDQIPKMRAQMVSIQASYIKVEAKRAELLGLTRGMDPLYFAEEDE